MDLSKIKIKNREEILAGNYARVEILVPASEDEDYSAPNMKISIHNVKTPDMVCLIKCLDEVKANLYKEYPELKLAEKFIHMESAGQVVQSEE